MMESKLCKFLVVAPIAITAVYMLGLVPAEYESILIWSIFAVAALSCFALSKHKKDALYIAGLPALICVLSGIDGLYDYVNYGHGTVNRLMDQFCYFICGVWCIYSIVAHNKEK